MRTFNAGKHFACYVDGIISIGCKSYTPKEWLENYKHLAEQYKYSKDEIRYYLSFINSCIIELESNTHDIT